MKQLLLSAIALVLLQTPSTAHAQITIDTSNATDWKISNGVITVDWLPGDGRIFSIHWSALPNQEIIDTTNKDHNGPKGFYMDNVGPGSGTTTNNYYLDPNGKYIDWWNTNASSSTNAFTWSQHHILFANDPGIHIYFTLDHGSSDIAGSIGQIQWVLRSDLNQFTNTYSVNTGLGNLGATTVPMPPAVLFGTASLRGRTSRTRPTTYTAVVPPPTPPVPRYLLAIVASSTRNTTIRATNTCIKPKVFMAAHWLPGWSSQVRSL